MKDLTSDRASRCNKKVPSLHSIGGLDMAWIHRRLYQLRKYFLAQKKPIFAQSSRPSLDFAVIREYTVPYNFTCSVGVGDEVGVSNFASTFSTFWF